MGINHTHYISDLVLQIFAGYKRGTGGNKALPAPEEEFGEGTSRMQIITAGLDLTYPFTMGNQPFRFNTSWNGQWNRTPLTQQDNLVLVGVIPYEGLMVSFRFRVKKVGYGVMNLVGILPIKGMSFI